MTTEHSISAADHRVKTVTVYKSSKAEVTRLFTIDLSAGRNKIEISNISSVVDTESIRVSGLGKSTRLFDVVCNMRQRFGHDLSATLKQLRVEKDKLEREKAVREHEATMLVTYGQSISGEHVKPDDMQQFLKTFLDLSNKNITAAAEINQKLEEVQRKIDDEAIGKSTRKGKTDAVITMVVVANEEGPHEFKLTYLVTNASWSPIYELQATSLGGEPLSTVKLNYRARITQSTGEDWADTSLTLSTVEADLSAQKIPVILPIRIAPQAKRGGLFGPNQQGRNNAGFMNTNAFNGKGVTAARGGLFGAANVQQPQQMQQLQQQMQQQPIFQQQQQARLPQQQPGSIFGAPQYGGGAFGSTGSGFGASAQPAQGGALFGSAPLAPPPPPPPGASAFGASSAPTLSPYGAAPATDLPPIPDETEEYEEITPDTQALSEPNMVVSETPVALSYSVEEVVTIPSDGDAHQVSVSVLPLEATIDYITVPRVEPKVYLECAVKNTSDLRLLPGPIQVIFNDSYVSEAQMHDTNVGESFRLTLGQDSSARVTYTRKQETEKISAGAFAEQWNLTTHKTSITIRNLHKFDLSHLIVSDTVPYVPHESAKRATVVLKKPNELVSAKKWEMVTVKSQEAGKESKVKWINDESGFFRWYVHVPAGESVTLEEEWEVKTPGDEVWLETNPNLFFGQK